MRYLQKVSVSLADLTMRKVQIIESKLFPSFLGEMNILNSFLSLQFKLNCVLYVIGVRVVLVTQAGKTKSHQHRIERDE